MLVCCEPECDNEFLYPGRGPKNRRCETCKASRTRAQVRENMRRHRAKQAPEQVEQERSNYRLWYAANAAAARAKSLAWYYANRDRAAENRRAWDSANPDYNRRWVEENRDRHNAKKHRRRAREAEAFVEDIDPAVVYRRDRGTCYLCGRQVPRVVDDALSPSLDHVIPLVRGGPHSYDNIRLAHRICNARKGAKEVMPYAFT